MGNALCKLCDAALDLNAVSNALHTYSEKLPWLMHDSVWVLPLVHALNISLWLKPAHWQFGPVSESL